MQIITFIYIIYTRSVVLIRLDIISNVSAVLHPGLHQALDNPGKPPVQVHTQDRLTE